MHLDEEGPVRLRQADGMEPIRLLLADDHLMITEALATRLSAAPDIWVAGRCAATDPNLMAIVKGVRPHVIAIEAAPFGAGMCVCREAADAWVAALEADTSRGQLGVRGAGVARGEDLDIVFTTVKHGWESGLFHELILTHLMPADRSSLVIDLVKPSSPRLVEE